MMDEGSCPLLGCAPNEAAAVADERESATVAKEGQEPGCD